ncbi:glycosyltransferase [Thioalkalivibrio sp. ALE23]|uniref:glycosyltransferase n=1 Tax=Thioalkalivibrio sp. ALE23 TaxID=1265495 RepID=UPI000368D187|nr:glycosyltransferase [Thioalkalivibrio sp. ALE23]
MKILVLTKRHHMGLDALTHLHGRCFAIPEELACLGHDVRGLVADYRPAPGNDGPPSDPAVSWEVLPIRSGPLLRFDRYLRAIRRTIRTFEPDLIWTGSDALITVVGERAARRHGIPSIIDLKDNYEAFGLTRFPGLRRMLHSAIRNAHAVTCASQDLAQYASQHGAHRTLHLPNAADGHRFRPLDRNQVRAQLGLPTDLRLFGTAGSLTSDRGIDILSRAAAILGSRLGNTGLLVAGPRDASWQPPTNLPVYDLGQIPLEQVPLVLNALDVGVICNIPGQFGSYCYPQKLHEMLACHLPVVAARTGPFASTPTPHGVVSTYPPDSPGEVANAIERALTTHLDWSRSTGRDTWYTRAASFIDFAQRITHSPV